MYHCKSLEVKPFRTALSWRISLHFLASEVFRTGFLLTQMHNIFLTGIFFLLLNTRMCTQPRLNQQIFAAMNSCCNLCSDFVGNCSLLKIMWSFLYSLIWPYFKHVWIILTLYINTLMDSMVRKFTQSHFSKNCITYYTYTFVVRIKACLAFKIYKSLKL